MKPEHRLRNRLLKLRRFGFGAGGKKLEAGEAWMAIECQIDSKSGIAIFHSTSLPRLEDDHAGFAFALKKIAAARLDRWLALMEHSPSSSDESILAFNEFVAREISRYVSSLAVVRPVQGHARLHDVTEPVRNQGKQVGIFETVEDARDWRCEPGYPASLSVKR